MSAVLASLPVVTGNAFDARAAGVDGRRLTGSSVGTVQANIGLRCNLACHHCHVESGPNRREEMTWETMQDVLSAARRANAHTLDITGGAPEMHPHFRRLVVAARQQGLGVIDRTNLTILLEDGYADLPAFLAEHRVRLVASLPCYLEANVDKQRGRGVYKESIDAIRKLNVLGYGTDADLPLDLVYNPGGPGLPPPQATLEADYKRELAARYNIRFTRLLTITNMPIGRFLHDIARQGKAEAYWDTLKANFNAAALPGLMCRHQVHVGWDGTVHDCDFNFAINLPVNDPGQRHVRDFDPGRFVSREIATGDHCFACTAGAGSSCGGAIT